MAKMKFDLKIGNTKIRKIEELRENFDPIEVLVQYRKSNTLYRWLDVHGHDELAEKVSSITSSDDTEILSSLSEIFDVEIVEKSELEKLLDKADKLYEKEEFENALDVLEEALGLDVGNDEIEQKIEACKEEIMQGKNPRGIVTEKEKAESKRSEEEKKTFQDEMENLEGITFKILDDMTVKITDIDGAVIKKDSHGLFTVPTYILGLPVSSITPYFIDNESSDICSSSEPLYNTMDYSSFKNLEDTKLIFTISNKLKIIKKAAFMDSPLFEINIPSSIEYIGKKAFYDCKKLEILDISDSVVYIGNSAFSDCKQLEKLDIPNSVVYIGNWAFSYCDKLEKIDIPSSVRHIGYNAFCLDNLKELNIANGITRIGKEAFSWKSGVTTVNIPDSVTEICEKAFFTHVRIKLILPAHFKKQNVSFGAFGASKHKFRD